MATRLSSLLVRDGVVDVGTMERAFRRKDLEGGRLGTILLELGAIDESTVHEYLSRALDMPRATEGLLGDIDDDVLRELEVEDVLAYGVIPAAIRDDVLYVLVRDPLDEVAADAVSRRVARPIRQFVLPAFRYEHALAELYGVRPSRRASALIQNHPFQIGRRGMSGSVVTVPGDGVAVAAQRLGDGWTADQLSRFLAHCDMRDDIVQAMLGFAHNNLPRCVVLAVTHGHLRGFASRGMDADPEQIRAVEIDGARVLRDAQSKGSQVVFEGLAPDLGLSGLYEALGLDRPVEMVCFVLRIGSRPAMILAGDNESRPVSRAALPQVESAVRQAAAGLIRLVRKHKRAQRNKAPEPEPVAPPPVAADPTDENPTVTAALSALDEGWDVEDDDWGPTVEVDSVAGQLAADAQAAPAEADNGADPETADLHATMPASPSAIEASGSQEAVADDSADELDDFEDETDAELDDLMFGEIERLVLEEHGDESVDEGLDPAALTDMADATAEEVAAARRARALAQAEALSGVDPITADEHARAARSEPSSHEVAVLDGFESPKALVNALTSADESIALKARAGLLLGGAQALEHFATAFPGSVKQAVTSLGDVQSVADCGPLLAAALELGQSFVAQLWELSRRDDREQRLYAVLCLHEVRHPDNLPALADRLFDDDPTVRRVTSQVLKSYARHDGFGRVLEQIRDVLAAAGGPKLQPAIEAARELGDSASVPALIELLGRGNSASADAAESALEAIAFQSLGGEPKKWRRWLKKHGNENRGAWMVAGATSRNRRIRELVKKAIDTEFGVDIGYDPDDGRRNLRRAAARLGELLRTRGPDRL